MKFLLTILFIIFLSGCVSTPMQWHASGGSKADGIVELSYTYNYMQKPVTSETQGVARAGQMCMSWGYLEVEALDFLERSCQMGDYLGCDVWVVTRKYQCINRLTEQ